MKNDVACVLLAGGIGERLYPISSPEHPKFLLKSEGKTLLELAYERAKKICGENNVYIVSTKWLKEKILKSIKNFREENFIEEPQRKNTLPAFIISYIKIQEKNVLAFFPCDHIIEKEKEFILAINKGIEAARKGFLTLIGIKPSEPSSHYGYIIPDKKMGEKIYTVKTFEEKPERKRAQFLIKKGGVWNSGIYIVSRKRLRELLETHQKEIFEKFEKDKNLESVYEELPSLSFDKGITEKEKNLAVIKGNFYWCDIGSFQAIIEHIKKTEGVITGGEVSWENCKRVLAVSWEKPLYMNEICDMIILINGEKAEIRSIKDGRRKRR
jgi:mannose-1-phosphate guanylyltransferase